MAVLLREETLGVEMTENMDFAADPVQGYFVDFRHATDTMLVFAHTFCGPQDVSGAWCPNCQKPLLRFLALDTRDERLNFPDSPSATLPLMFCWTCNIAQQAFFYRVLADRVELLGYGQGGVETDFPYKDYPVFFPEASTALQAVSAEEQIFLKRLNSRFETDTEGTRSDLYNQHPELWEVRHQVGGEPFLIGDLTRLTCPDCGDTMPFLASIADACLDPRGLLGDEGVQMLYYLCRPCRVVGAYQMTD